MISDLLNAPDPAQRASEYLAIAARSASWMLASKTGSVKTWLFAWLERRNRMTNQRDAAAQKPELVEGPRPFRLHDDRRRAR